MMKLVRRLVVGLLLSGALFATGCAGQYSFSEPVKSVKDEACTQSDQCESPLVCLGKTDHKVCADKPGDGQVEDGQGCTEDKECKSGKCDATSGVCVAKTTKKGKDETCTMKDECQDGLVCLGATDHKVCADKPGDGQVEDGQGCTEDKECKSGKCDATSGVCVAKTTKKGKDETCTKSDECQDGLVCLGKTGSKVCADKPAQYSLKNNESCSADDECKSGKCDDDVCKSSDKERTPCVVGTTSTCPAPLVCLNSLCSQKPDDHTVMEGGACTEDNQCEVGFTCGKTSHTCEAMMSPATKKQAGETCSLTSECADKLVCLGDKCATKPTAHSVNDGDPCVEDDDCHAESECKVTSMGGSKTCEKIAQHKRFAFESCTKGDDCFSGKCDTNDSVCLPEDHSVNIGGRCSKDVQCLEFDAALNINSVCIAASDNTFRCSIVCDDTNKDTQCGLKDSQFKCENTTKAEGKSLSVMACVPDLVSKGGSCANGKLCEKDLYCLNDKCDVKPPAHTVADNSPCTGDDNECSVTGHVCSKTTFKCEAPKANPTT